MEGEILNPSPPQGSLVGLLKALNGHRE
jgi:hypothetical protein